LKGIDWKVKIDIAAGLVVCSFVVVTGWMLSVGGSPQDEHVRPLAILFVSELPFIIAALIWLILRHSQRIYDWVMQR
jgi:hypothetical protein